MSDKTIKRRTEDEVFNIIKVNEIDEETDDEETKEVDEAEPKQAKSPESVAVPSRPAKSSTDNDDESEEEYIPDSEDKSKKLPVRSISEPIVSGKNGYKWKTTPDKTFTQEQSSSIQEKLYSAEAREEAIHLTSPIQFWSLLFTDTIIEVIVLNTNKEIFRKFELLSDKEKKLNYYKKTDKIEIKALIGLFYMRGLLKPSECTLQDLWSQLYGVIHFRAAMSMQRFKFLVNCLRFDDKRTRGQWKESGKLPAIQQIWDIFIDNCQRYYLPSHYCTIDKQLLEFRGKCPFRVHMKSKPEQYGLNIVMMNDAKTGYMINAMPYLGKVDTEELETMPEYYVRELSKPIHGTERNITTDKWFTSVPLVKRMRQNYSLTMIGSMSKNKGEIPEKLLEPGKLGTSLFVYDSDNMLVSHLSEADNVLLILSSLNQGSSNDQKTKQPAVVVKYNNTKIGTDLFNNFCNRCTVAMEVRRWSLRFFHGMLDQAGVNSLILYNFNGHNPTLMHRSFLCSLSNSLLEPFLKLQLPTLRKTLRYCINEIIAEETSNSRNLKNK